MLNFPYLVEYGIGAIIKMADLSGTILDGKYELSRLIGEGGMGTVYEATHRLIGRRLAVKFLHTQYVASEEVVTRFQREAQAAAAIGHENIIEVTDMGQAPDGAPYIVMEFLDGSDIKRVLADEGAISPPRAAHVMVQALSALQAAHDAGIIHRDLKPENIYLVNKPDRPYYVKLLDFGISKFRSLEAEGSKGLTQTGTVLGTPYYMSPEQARGDQDISVKSDVYAMGVILYQMLTGTLPFDAPNYNALLIKILTEDPPPPEAINPDIPPELADAIKIAMARSPRDRFKNCIEFRKRLLPFVPGSSSVHLETGLSPASRTAVMAALATDTETPLEMTRTNLKRTTKRLPLIIIAVLVVVTAVVVEAWNFTTRNTEKAESDRAIAPAPASTASPGREEQTPPPKIESIRVKVSVQPKEAKIKLDGRDLDENPFAGSFPKSETIHQLIITADGYKALMAETKFDQDRVLVYTLEKIGRAGESIGAAEGPRSTQKSSSSKSAKKKSDETQVEETKTDKKADKADKPKKKPKRKIDDEDPWS
jgi:serine/threonine protein kinase